MIFKFVEVFRNNKKSDPVSGKLLFI